MCLYVYRCARIYSYIVMHACCAAQFSAPTKLEPKRRQTFRLAKCACGQECKMRRAHMRELSNMICTIGQRGRATPPPPHHPGHYPPWGEWPMAWHNIPTTPCAAPSHHAALASSTHPPGCACYLFIYTTLVHTSPRRLESRARRPQRARLCTIRQGWLRPMVACASMYALTRRDWPKSIPPQGL